jgi:hypothetical protein
VVGLGSVALASLVLGSGLCGPDTLVFSLVAFSSPGSFLLLDSGLCGPDVHCGPLLAALPLTGHCGPVAACCGCAELLAGLWGPPCCWVLDSVVQTSPGPCGPLLSAPLLTGHCGPACCSLLWVC